MEKMRLLPAIYFLVTVFFAHLTVWLQLNYQFFETKWKPSQWFLVIMGVPISWLWIKATQFGVETFDGKFWPQRLIAFAIGMIIYTVLTSIVFGERVDTKTLVCLALASCIVLVQVFWR
jgi:hypothetical protein